MNLLNVLRDKRLIRYLGVASFIVALELSVFQVIYLLSNEKYILATICSFIFAVVLNWIMSRVVVFGASHHHPAKEFLLVLAASIFGVGIQLSVVWGSVDTLHMYPLFGKVLSIGFSFFWNYWFRANFIYRGKNMSVEETDIA